LLILPIFPILPKPANIEANGLEWKVCFIYSAKGLLLPFAFAKAKEKQRKLKNNTY
jgi:hypothetical protein